jgi:hypothetical protein
MSTATKFLVMLIAASAILPTTAAIAADATLYELSEEMMVVDGHRKATASFQGIAELGTPLCPHALVSMLNLPVRSCTVTGVGSDDVDIDPASASLGTGRLQGTFAVVVNADNVVDAPEYVVMTGRFAGNMSLAAAAEFTGKKQTAGPATQRITLSDGTFIPENIAGLSPESLAAYVLTNGASLDASAYDPAVIAGAVRSLGIGPASFTGVFRLPFAVSNGHKEKARKDGRDAYYLGDNDTLIKVRKDEMALGYPTVRIEVTFGR